LTVPFDYYLGIDPGRSGALAVLDADAKLLELHDVSSGEELGVLTIEPVLVEVVKRGKALVIVERPLAFPGVPAQDQITLALAAGAAAGVCRSLGATVEFPTASQWKRKSGLTSDKKLSQERARQLFGDALPKRVRHDKCEAALLAHYGYQKHNTWKIATTCR